VTWREIERGIRIDNFRIDNVPARVARRGDLWAPIQEQEGRFSMDELI
jgi:bifunctional non-homologous end joining protein LigD